jgi:hypothetical protein
MHKRRSSADLRFARKVQTRKAPGLRETVTGARAALPQNYPRRTTEDFNALQSTELEKFG